MRNRGLKGVSGEPHWKVGRDVRRRTSLESAGGYRGTGETMLGLAESGVMVYMANQAKRGTPLILDDIEGILRDVAIKLGCTATATGQLYTPLTDVRKLTDAFVVRSQELGVPFVEKAGQGLPLQRAQAATVETVKEYMVKVRGVNFGKLLFVWCWLCAAAPALSM